MFQSSPRMNLSLVALILYILSVIVILIYESRKLDKHFVLELGAHAVIISLLCQPVLNGTKLSAGSIISDSRVFIACNLASFLLGGLIFRNRQGNAKAKTEVKASTEAEKASQKFKLKSRASISLSKSDDQSTKLNLAMPSGSGAIASVPSMDDEMAHSALSEIEWKQTFEEAKHVVQVISDMNVTGKNEYSTKLWTLVQSGPQSHIWSQNPVNDVLLRATAVFKCNTETLIKVLKDLNFLMCIEGIFQSVECVERMDDVNDMTMHTMTSKVRSLTSSLRDFTTVTGHCILDNGNLLYATRSVPNDITVSNNTKQKGNQKKKGNIRGVVYGSGYIVRTMKSSDGYPTSGLSISIHLDMRGSSFSSSKQWNSTKSQELIAYLKDSIQKIQSACEYSNKGNSNIASESKRVDSVSLTSTNAMSSPKVSSMNKSPSWSSDNDLIQLDPKQKRQLSSVLDSAMFRLRTLHKPFFVQGRGDSEVNVKLEGWETIFDNGIVCVREQTADSSSPMGVLSAFSSFDVSPETIKNILTNQIDDVDGLLESKSVLCRLSAHTCVQWLAYRSIWPIGARDFLLITSSEAFDRASGEGFALVSTSIDHICELELEDEDPTKQGATEYTRTLLRLAGYVGVPNKNGGTDLYLFVDVDVYSYIPAWLIQMLAQYGLSEIMNRIRTLSVGGVVSSSSSVVNSAPTSSNFEFNKMLSIIQTREEKLQRLIDSSASPSPILPSLLQSPTSNKSNPLFPEDNKANGNTSSSVSVPNTPTTTASTEPNANYELPAWAEALPLKTGPFRSDLSYIASESTRYIQMYFGTIPSPDIEFDWQLKATKKSTNIWTSMTKNSSWQAIRGTTVIAANKMDILKLLLDDKRIGEYDDMFDTFQYIASVDKYTSIRRMLFKAIWPTSPRDFVACTTWRCLPDGSVIVSTRSAPDSLCPPEKGFVRGFIHISGYWIQPSECLNDPASVPAGHCKVSLAAHTELGGSLPVSVINMLSSAAPLKLLGTIGDIVTK